MDVRGSGTANENLQLLGADSMETVSLALKKIVGKRNENQENR